MTLPKKYELKIGSLALKSPTLLAPMEAVNSESFIKTCAHYSCGLVSTQAIESVEDNFYDLESLKKIPSPVSFQIMTNKAETALELAKLVEPFVDVIDFNFGCPLKKTLGEKKGGYLLQFPHLIKRIVEPVVKAVNIPVSIKIRLGFDKDRETFLEIGRLAESIGVSAITLHARYVKDGYRGKADWEKIKELKKSSGIPVIANGDIFKPGQAKMLLDQDYCDGVMLGRGAKNNPSIFLSIKEVLESLPEEKRTEVSAKEIFNFFYEDFVSSSDNLHQLQDHASWFVSGEKNASWLKQRIKEKSSFEEIKLFINKNIN